jgi:hypothetical protein
VSRSHGRSSSVGSKRTRKRQSPSLEYLRKRRPDPVSPELCQNIRLRSRPTCPRDQSRHLVRKALSPRQGPRPICQPSPLQPPHLDRPSLVGWLRCPADQTLPRRLANFVFGAWPTFLGTHERQPKENCSSSARSPCPPREARFDCAPANFVSSASGQMELCLNRFWYAVSLGSGISRETSRISFWNLTVMVSCCCSS